MIEHLGSWIFWAGVPTLALGTLIVLGALGMDWFRRKIRGRTERCPRCWYDMAGTPGLTCPECGRTAKSRAHLLKSRRRWVWAAIGLLLVTLGAFGVSPSLRQVNWLKAAPTWLLLWAMDQPCPPVSYNTPPTFAVRLAGEVWRREALGRLSRSQCASLARRQMEAIRGPLIVHTRTEWPGGEHVWATFEPRFAGVRPRELRVRIPGGSSPDILLRDDTDMNQRGAVADSVLPYQRGETDRELLDLGVPAPAAAEIVLETEIREGGEVVYQGVVRVPTRLRAGAEEIVPPMSDAAASQALREGIEMGLSLAPDRDAMCLVRPLASIADPTALALRVEIRDGDETVARTEIVLRFGPSKPNAWGYLEQPDAEVWRHLTGDVARLRTADVDSGRWSVLVTGDPILALRVFDAKFCWNGNLVEPLKAVMRKVVAPPKPRLDN